MRADPAKRPDAAGLLHTLLASLRIFDPAARARLAVLLLTMIGGAAFEAAGAAVIVPFIALINDPGYLSSQPVIANLFAYSGLSSPDAFIIAASIGLLVFFIAKNIYLMLMTNAQFRFVFTEMPRFSSDLFARSMARPLSAHAQTNSAEMIRNVSNEVFMFFNNFLIPAMTLLTEVLVLLAILVVLLWIAPLPTIAAIVVLGGLTKLFYRFIRPKIRRFGQLQQLHNTERIKWINQGLGSIKEIKVLGREQYFIDRFCRHEREFAESARYAMTLNQTPRLYIETIAFSALFAGVAAALLSGQDRGAVLPVLALFAVASVRLLPSLNRTLLSITRMAYYRPAAEIVLASRADSGQEQSVTAFEASKSLGNWKELRLDQVSFAYPGAGEVLTNLNLSIPRGASVALVGPSGSGKTTIADLVLGLHAPTRGRILIDDEDVRSYGAAWRRRLGYIPQTIYLLDDSIRRNVAFGLPDEAIDDVRVWNALRLARLDEHVRQLPGQLDAAVGEDGGKLSGGQRQRLGIARALYDDPDFIVLDEATSALDEKTEREIAETLESLQGEKTLLVIAHRPETINRCQYKFAVNQRKFVS